MQVFRTATPCSRVAIMLEEHEAEALADMVQTYADHYGVSCCNGLALGMDPCELLDTYDSMAGDASDHAKDSLAAQACHQFAARFIGTYGEAPTDHAITHFGKWFSQPDDCDQPCSIDPCDPDDPACSRGGEEE